MTKTNAQHAQRDNGVRQILLSARNAFQERTCLTQVTTSCFTTTNRNAYAVLQAGGAQKGNLIAPRAVTASGAKLAPGPALCAGKEHIYTTINLCHQRMKMFQSVQFPQQEPKVKAVHKPIPFVVLEHGVRVTPRFALIAWPGIIYGMQERTSLLTTTLQNVCRARQVNTVQAPTRNVPRVLPGNGVPNMRLSASTACTGRI